MQAAVGALLAGLLEHALGDVYTHQVPVAEHAQDATEHAGARAGVQHGPFGRDVAPHEAGRHGGYRVPQAQHVVFVVLRPPVVAARQLPVVPGRVRLPQPLGSLGTVQTFSSLRGTVSPGASGTDGYFVRATTTTRLRHRRDPRVVLRGGYAAGSTTRGSLLAGLFTLRLTG